MQLIYTPEAQAFVLPRFEDEKSRPPMLGYFLSSATGLMSRKPLKEQKVIASQVMCKVEDRHDAILRLLRPFLFVNGDGLFDGLSGIPAFDDHLVISHLVMPAVDLVADYDILVALIRRYPDVHADNAAVLDSAQRAVFSAIKSTKKAARSVNSGRLLGDGHED